jgi:hypothetical protein
MINVLNFGIHIIIQIIQLLLVLKLNDISDNVFNRR